MSESSVSRLGGGGQGDNGEARFSFRSFGPGILLASAAIGGSHLVSSTQAGALFGWQLVVVIVLVNLFKYPFFRFGTDYVYDTGQSLIAGYARKSRGYLWVFFGLSVVASVISTGAVALLSAVILGFMLPEGVKQAWGLSPTVLTFVVLLVSWGFLLWGHYRMLDKVTKVIMGALTVTTVLAVCVAATNPVVPAPDFVPKSPWSLATLGFIVALMGWMPAPIEFAAINSMWTAAKIRDDHTSHGQGLVDFNTGYLMSAILAVFFLALGVFVQYGSGQEIQTAGGAYVGQLINMYTATIGEWSRFLVALIAFMCMFGTTITCADGYGRSNAESWRLICGQASVNHRQVAFWTTYAIVGGLIIVVYFAGQLGAMLRFAMISAFVSAPVFAWLNYSLVKGEQRLSVWVHILSMAGLVFLLGFTVIFLLDFFKLLS